MMTSISDIETLAKAYAAEREKLMLAYVALDVELDKLKRARLPGIKRYVAKAAELHAQLAALVADAPDLFVRPRTVIVHGIKIGYEKGKGSVCFDDADQVIKLLRKHMPEQLDALVKVTETPRKTAIAALSVAEAKRIGCTVVNAGDQVVIRPVDSEIDKLVDKLLESAVAQEQVA
jgi:hypothetical protein